MAQGGYAALAAIVAVLVVVLLGAVYLTGGLNLGSVAPVSSPGNQSSLIGGTVTSLSNVQFVSNYAGISGPAFLTTFTINGKGQAYSGTTQSTAQGINSSYQSSVSNPVSITYALNSEKLSIPYTFSGTNIYKWSTYVVNTGYSFTHCPFGVTCEQNYTNGNYTFIGAAIGIPFQTVSQAAQGFQNSCANVGNGATTILTTAYSTTYLGLGGYYITLQCVQPKEINWGSVYSVGNGNLAINASITYSNGTQSHTLYLTNNKDSSYYSNILYAQIYGYSSSGSQLLTAQVPMLTVVASNGLRVLSPQSSISSVIDTISNSFPSSWLVSYQQIGGYTVSGIYTASNLQGNINSTNQQLNDLLYPLQPTSPYYGMTFIPGTTIGSINVTSDPLYYPEVQLITKVSTLSIVVPVAKPVIQSVSTSPTTLTSGSSTTATINVFNNGTEAASVGLTVACGSQTFTGQTISVPADGSASGVVSITSLSNPNLANEAITCVATATSSSYGLYTSSKPFVLTITPVCPSGYVYVNNQNCQPEQSQGNLTSTTPNSQCVAGYKWNSSMSTCQQVAVCPSGYIENTTTTPPICEPPVKSSGWPLWEVILVIVAVLGVAGAGIYLWSKRR